MVIIAPLVICEPLALGIVNPLDCIHLAARLVAVHVDDHLTLPAKDISTM